MCPIFGQRGQQGGKAFLDPAPGVRLRHGQRPIHKIHRRSRPSQHGRGFHARLDHGGGQIRAAGTVRNAEKLFVRAVAIVRYDARAPNLFGFRRPGPGRIRPLADGLEKSVRYGVVKRGAVQAVLAFPGPDFLDQLVERVFLTVVR